MPKDENMPKDEGRSQFVIRASSFFGRGLSMRIAIVNDLALAREVLRRLVQSVPGYRVAWTAENGEEAVRKAAQDRPDIILMDLVMPVLDGVEATRRIMATSPCPILLVTSSVTGNFNLVYRAMGSGGLDAVNTPTLAPDGTVKDGEGILARIAKLARQQQLQVQTASGSTSACVAHPGRSEREPQTEAPQVPLLLAVGASTGGPDALARILKELPTGCPISVIIVQHIAAEFAKGLAIWLQGYCGLPVRLAENGDELKVGEVLLAGTDDHLKMSPDRRLVYTADPVDYPYRPSVNVLFQSLAENWPRPGMAIVLTGMGRDGAQGLLRLRQLGWHTLTQDQASCVVYGMPKAAADLRAACQVLPLGQIPAAVVDHIKHQQQKGTAPAVNDRSYPSSG
jgi:two-component system response regulator WspF